MSTQPGLLSACELATLRAAAEMSLDTPITLTRVTRTPTPGGYSETTTVLATCNARFGTPTASELAVIADRIGAQQAWRVSIPTSVPLPQPGDTLTITADGSRYTVQVVLQPQSYSTLNKLLVGKLS